MKDFQSIPKSQIFTREQLKAIRGGDDTTYYGDGNKCDTGCVTNIDCTGTKCTTCDNVANGRHDSKGNILYDRVCVE
ncbi:hypothetical protein [Mucilaginibacter sp.]|uniref:hypothetical protein n=1 Tax=Mucilaginibacter sp. TaxID=1882438 RepID=UPI003B00F309